MCCESMTHWVEWVVSSISIYLLLQQQDKQQQTTERRRRRKEKKDYYYRVSYILPHYYYYYYFFSFGCSWAQRFSRSSLSMALSTPSKPPIVSAQTSNSGEFTGGGHGKVALLPAFVDRGILCTFLAALLLPPHFASFVGCTDEVLDSRDMARLLL